MQSSTCIIKVKNLFGLPTYNSCLNNTTSLVIDFFDSVRPYVLSYAITIIYYTLTEVICGCMPNKYICLNNH